MLTRLRFKRLQNRACGCDKVRIIPRPLHRPADGRTVYIQSTGHLAFGDRQLPSGNIANQGGKQWLWSGTPLTQFVGNSAISGTPQVAGYCRQAPEMGLCST